METMGPWEAWKIVRVALAEIHPCPNLPNKFDFRLKFLAETDFPFFMFSQEFTFY